MTDDQKSFKIVQKSKRSEEAFLCLKEQHYFTASIHCCYYSCFQLVLALLMKFFPEKYEGYKRKKSSHKLQITFFLGEYYEIDESNATRVERQIFQLKELRRQADYSEVLISKEVANKSGQKLVSIHKFIKQDFSQLFEAPES